MGFSSIERRREYQNWYYHNIAKARQSEKSREKYRKTVKIYLFHSAKKRAKQFNIPFDITVEDITIPKYCPILTHLELRVGKNGGSEYSPTLDRIIPEKGYTKENIQVISHLANRIKSNASFEDLVKVGEWARSVLNLQ